MQVTIQESKTANATSIAICAKCSDRCAATLLADDGEELKDRDGYVPSFFPGNHYGDYVILNIELETGKILNWKPPTAEQIEAFINSK